MYKLIETIIDCVGTATKFKKVILGNVVTYEYDSKIYLPHYETIGELLEESVEELNGTEKIYDKVKKSFLELDDAELIDVEKTLEFLSKQDIQWIILGEKIKENDKYNYEYKTKEIENTNFEKELKLAIKKFNLNSIYK
jgi:hypothetical protein